MSSQVILFACSKCFSRHPFEELSPGQQLCKVSDPQASDKWMRRMHFPRIDSNAIKRFRSSRRPWNKERQKKGWREKFRWRQSRRNSPYCFFYFLDFFLLLLHLSSLPPTRGENVLKITNRTSEWIFLINNSFLFVRHWKKFKFMFSTGMSRKLSNRQMHILSIWISADEVRTMMNRRPKQSNLLEFRSKVDLIKTKTAIKTLK